MIAGERHNGVFVKSTSPRTPRVVIQGTRVFFCTFIADEPAFVQFMKQANFAGLEVGSVFLPLKSVSWRFLNNVVFGRRR